MRVSEAYPDLHALVLGERGRDGADERALRASVVGVAGGVAVDAGARERGQDGVEVLLLPRQAVDAVEEDDVAATCVRIVQETVEALPAPAVPGAAREEVEVLEPADDGPALGPCKAGDLVPLDLGGRSSLLWSSRP